MTTKLDILAKLETIRNSLKSLSERELQKSAIPVHNHKPGGVASSGVEDIAPGKLNPRGIDKAEKCMKCGEMHESIKKCGEVKVNKGETKPANTSTCKECFKPATGSHCHNCGARMFEGAAPSYKLKHGTPKESGEKVKVAKMEFKDGASAPKIPAKGSGGLPKKSMKKAMTAGGGVAVPSTKVNELGKTTKAEPPTAKPPSGKNMATHVSVSKPSTGTLKSEELEKGVLGDIVRANSAPHPAAAASPVAPKLPTPAQQAGRAQGFTQAMAGQFQPKGPISSGLELASKPKAPQTMAASPAKPAASKPGIFGRLLGGAKR